MFFTMKIEQMTILVYMIKWFENEVIIEHRAFV